MKKPVKKDRFEIWYDSVNPTSWTDRLMEDYEEYVSEWKVRDILKEAYYEGFYDGMEEGRK